MQRACPSPTSKASSDAAGKGSYSQQVASMFFGLATVRNGSQDALPGYKPDLFVCYCTCFCCFQCTQGALHCSPGEKSPEGTCTATRQQPPCQAVHRVLQRQRESNQVQELEARLHMVVLLCYTPCMHHTWVGGAGMHVAEYQRHLLVVQHNLQPSLLQL